MRNYRDAVRNYRHTREGEYPEEPGGCTVANDVNMNALEIRVATIHDLESLADALGPEAGTAQLSTRFEENRTGIRTMLVAVQDGRAMGTISIGGGQFQRVGSLRLFALNVGQAFRRRGVGTALVKAVEAIAAERGLAEVNLEVTINNEYSIRLYRNLGYRICGDTVTGRWERKLDDGSSETIGSASVCDGEEVGLSRATTVGL